MWQVFSERDSAMLLPRKYQDLLSKEWSAVFHDYADLFKAAQRAWRHEARLQKQQDSKRQAAKAAEQLATQEAERMAIEALCTEV